MRGEMIISPLIIIVDRGEMAISPLMIYLSIDFDITWQINYIFLPRLFISGLLGNGIVWVKYENYRKFSTFLLQVLPSFWFEQALYKAFSFAFLRDVTYTEVK